MNEFDGTNPILSALGDMAIVRDVTILNKGFKKHIEPLTGIHLLPEQTVIIRVTGDAAFENIKKNIDQINFLKNNSIEFNFELSTDES
ncbi:hypothetical protein [Acinetobacter sp. Ac_5812]|uniref:hypothetical protein n=1 Tax=Acinetobacter sp. Ac_5812 TaxID=1848937 RepID=UPI0014902CFE|nr:hypothetical protein [Acinetobacter sp. Ac_5812]NNP70389.1 hypothetical protein [Acinetobacter sp. Ac_5812]